MAKKAWLWFSLFLIASLVLVACSEAQAEDRPPLKVEWTIWESDYTLLIAQEKGFFAKHGVEVEPVFYSVYSQVFPDMGVKKIDGSLLALGDLLSVANIAQVRAVAVQDSGGTLRVMARPEIDSVAALRGKSLGLPLDTFGELMVRQMLQSAGMTVGDVTLINTVPEFVPEKLSSGEIAAGFVWSPWDRKALDGGNKVLYERSADVPLSPNMIVFNEEIIQERPEDVRAFLKAWFEALEYRNANQAECYEIIARLTNQTVEEVKPIEKINLYTLNDNLEFFDANTAPEMSIYKMAEMNLQFMIEQGTISIPPKIENIIDPSFLQ